MKIGQQIQRLRAENNISQEQLAEKVYVSRQSISNWENDKNYPDVKSLLLISNIFNISLDSLVKGDIEEMTEQISKEELTVFDKNSKILAVLFILTLFTPIPLYRYLGYMGCVIWGVITLGCGYFSIKVEKQKKSLDVQTYKEIVALTQGKSLSREEKFEEKGKKYYQKFLLLVGSAILSVIISIIMMAILK